MCTMGNSEATIKKTQIPSIEMLNMRPFTTDSCWVKSFVIPKNSLISGKWKVNSNIIAVSVNAAKDPTCRVICWLEIDKALVFSFLRFKIATVKRISAKTLGRTEPS